MRKSKYPATPHDEAIALGEEARQRDTKGIFHFNPGKEYKTVYNNQEIEFKAKSTEDRLYDAVTLNKKRLTNLPKPAPIRADM